MNGEAPVLLAVEDGVARVTLNRPDGANALNMALADALAETLMQLAQDRAIRCVVLTGAGRMFCAGGDISGFSAAGDNAPAYVAALARRAHDSIAALARMQKPLLTLVNGPAAGFGLSLALAGDLVLAARSASFSTAYGGIGLTPDGGMSWVLPRLIGLRRAQDMLLGNRRVGAEEAERIGLITRLVEDEALAAEGAMLAAQLAAKPVAAFSAARALLLASYGSSLEDQLEREAATIGLAAAGAEFREGIGAFLAKRKPDFSGI
jgi:2-(1,2-epoxy-1,2-dihydrophenyl)acetyl-CoA isomerase